MIYFVFINKDLFLQRMYFYSAKEDYMLLYLLVFVVRFILSLLDYLHQKLCVENTLSNPAGEEINHQ